VLLMCYNFSRIVMIMTCGYGIRSDIDFSVVVRKGLIAIMRVAGLIFTC